MNLLILSWQNLRSRPLSTFMSLLLLTLGVGIISMLLLLNTQLRKNFNQNIQGIDLVVGAKGSPLQLILASVYHIDNPTGNIPLHEAEKLAAHPLIEKTIYMAYGDSYQGYRILGTDTSYVGHYKGKLKEGRLWQANYEVTLGAIVAERLGMKVGSEFFGQHGSGPNAETHDEQGYRVVGILEPSGTVLDQLIMTPIGSVWDIHGDHDEGENDEDQKDSGDHEDHTEEEPANHVGHSEEQHGEYGDGHQEGEEDPHEEERDITAMLVKFRSPMGMVMLPRMINEQTSMQAALPAIEINRLFGLFAVGIDTLRAIAMAIIIISGISVFVSLYNSLKERRYELALMRSMGASREQLFVLVVLEGLLLAGVGTLLGLTLSRGGMWLLSKAVIEDFHYQFSGNLLLIEEVYLIGATLVIGLIAAALPAIEAFKLNISETLAEG